MLFENPCPKSIAQAAPGRSPIELDQKLEHGVDGKNSEFIAGLIWLALCRFEWNLTLQQT